MRGRIGGATLAALGGLVLALSAVVPRWWHGPIHIAGKVIHGKTVHVSLLRVSGCNAGDGSCMGLDVGPLFRIVTLAALFATVATVVAAGLLARATVRSPASAPRFARMALAGAAASVIGGVATIVTLPARFEEIPVGGGSFTFFFGGFVVLAASIFTLASRPSRQVVPEPFDVREILSTDGLAPSALGPEPKLGRFGAVPQGPSAAAAPRFRPWYEVPSPGQSAAPASGAASSQSFSGPPTEPGFGPPGSSSGMQAWPAAPASATHVGVPLAPSGRAPQPAQVPAGSRVEVQGPTHVGVPVAPGFGGPVGGMSFDVSDVTNPANRLMAQRASAAQAQRPPVAEPVSEPLSSSALEPVSEPAMYEPLSTSALEPVSQPASELGSVAGPPTNADDDEEALRTIQVERLSSSELSDEQGAIEPEPTTDPAPAAPPTKGVLVREVAAGAAPKRPSIPRVPTATTSASLAALAALSKPAHITVASGVARTLPPPKPNDITQTNPAPACPTCVAPMGWVEKHRRFYCSNCRVYG